MHFLTLGIEPQIAQINTDFVLATEGPPKQWRVNSENTEKIKEINHRLTRIYADKTGILF